MSLINTLLAVPTVTDETGGYLKKYTVSAAEIAKLGAFTTGDIILDVFPAGSIVMLDRIKHSVAVAGAAGPITASTARLMFGATALGAGALDVYAAIGTADATNAITGVTPVVSPNALNATTNLVMRITETGATTGLSDVTAGSIDAYVVVKVLA